MDVHIYLNMYVAVCYILKFSFFHFVGFEGALSPCLLTLGPFSKNVVTFIFPELNVYLKSF